MKKFLSILLCLVVMLQFAVIPAFAGDGPVVGISNEQGEDGGVAGTTIEAEPGDKVYAYLVLEEGVLFQNISLEIGFDTEALEIVGIRHLSDAGSFTKSPNYNVQPYVVTFNDAGEVESWGDLARIQFKVKDTAYNGVYPITVDYYKFNGVNVDGVNCNYNGDKESLNLQYVNGSITVTGGQDRPGGAVETTLNAEKSEAGNVTNVAITATAETIEGKFIAAVYNGLQLVDAKIVDAAATANVALNGTGDKVKVFWWNNTTDCVPYCAPAIK